MTRIGGLALLMLLALPAGCGERSSNGPRTAPPLALQAPLSKRVLQGVIVDSAIVWIGNDRVAFRGFPPGHNNHTNLYLWDLQGPARQLLAGGYGVCATAGTLYTDRLEPSGRRQRLAFRSPDFKPIPVPDPPKVQEPSFWDKSSCSQIKSTPIPTDYFRVYLSEYKGFLVLKPQGNSDQKTWLGLYRGTDSVVEANTGIHLNNPLLAQKVYSSYDNSYLIFNYNANRDAVAKWLRTGSYRIWRLDPKLNGHAIDISKGPWVSESTYFLPTKKGIVITSVDFNRDYTPRGAGAYLLAADQNATRLERGLVQEAVASPNGCRLAYSYEFRLDADLSDGGKQVVAVNLCQ